jgi:hypothetical protein
MKIRNPPYSPLALFTWQRDDAVAWVTDHEGKTGSGDVLVTVREYWIESNAWRLGRTAA